MISKKHHNHGNIVRPALGRFGRHEWAITGAACPVIKELAASVLRGLSPAYGGVYADVEHAGGDAGKPGAGLFTEYTGSVVRRQINDDALFNPFRFRQWFSQADIVLVNGNHFEAQAQVLIIEPAKKASLQKRVAQFTNVQLLLLGNGMDEPFDFIQQALPHWRELPLYRLEETDKVIAFFKAQLEKAPPVVHGLVLAGGKSVRMQGNDKGRMDWHGMEQRYYMADLLKKHCNEVYISCRPEQQAEIDPARPTLPDTFTGLGPYGALLSALRAQPDAAWLVVACDLPLLNDTVLACLLQQRHRTSMATAFTSPYDGLPEPLIAIWEPKSYPVLLSFLAQGYSCPRKVLINSDTTLLTTPDADALTNVNSPEDAAWVRKKLEII